MPYVYRPYPQAVDFVDPGVQDVYHSNNCFINTVPVALWLPPGSTAAIGATNVPPDPQVVDYAPNEEQHENAIASFYGSFENPQTFAITRGKGSGTVGTMSSASNPAGVNTSDPNDLSGNPPSNPDGSFQKSLLNGGGSTTVKNSGTKLQASEMYNYIVGLGVKDPQAKALVANAARESSLNPCNGTGDGGTSAGLFQWHNERKTAMIQACPDWCTNWKCQIQYALYGEPRSLSGYDVGAWLNRDLTAEEAAKQWVYGWERPANPARDQQTNLSYLRQFFGVG